MGEKKRGIKAGVAGGVDKGVADMGVYEELSLGLAWVGAGVRWRKGEVRVSVWEFY